MQRDGGRALMAWMIVTVLVGCRNSQSPPSDILQVDPNALVVQLEEAYLESSEQKLGEFLRRWHESVIPVDVEQIDEPHRRELYAVFQAYYDPFELNAIGGDSGADFGREIEEHQRADYVVVQNTLDYQVAQAEKQTLPDFRPPLAFDNVEVLYLTPAYREALVVFLDAGKHPNEFDAEESIQRLRFLNKGVCVRAGHWSGWDLVTAPHISHVQLNEAMTKATVAFSIYSTGGASHMRRTPNGWKMVDTGLGWVE